MEREPSTGGCGAGFPSRCAGTLLTLAGRILLKDDAAAAELAIKILDLAIIDLEAAAGIDRGGRKSVSSSGAGDPDFRQS